MNPQWNPWPERFHYKVAKMIYSDFLGSGYKCARRGGCIMRFFTLKAATAYADKLNARLEA